MVDRGALRVGVGDHERSVLDDLVEEWSVTSHVDRNGESGVDRNGHLDAEHDEVVCPDRFGVDVADTLDRVDTGQIGHLRNTVCIDDDGRHHPSVGVDGATGVEHREHGKAHPTAATRPCSTVRSAAVASPRISPGKTNPWNGATPYQ